MKCINKSEAQRIAFFGAKKMAGLYTRTAACFHSVYHVRKVEEGTQYTVRVNNRFGRPNSCNCGFFLENEKFGTCKHIYFVMSELAEIAEYARRADEWTEAYSFAHGEDNGKY